MDEAAPKKEKGPTQKADSYSSSQRETLGRLRAISDIPAPVFTGQTTEKQRETLVDYG